MSRRFAQRRRNRQALNSKSVPGWSEADAAAASAEGWRLTEVLGDTALQEVNVLHRLIANGVLNRSPLHMKALALLFIHWPRRYKIVIDHIPENTGALQVRAVLAMARMMGAEHHGLD